MFIWKNCVTRILQNTSLLLHISDTAPKLLRSAVVAYVRLAFFHPWAFLMCPHWTILALDPSLACLAVFIAVHANKAECIIIIAAGTGFQSWLWRVSLSWTFGLGRCVCGLLLLLPFRGLFLSLRLLSFCFQHLLNWWACEKCRLSLPSAWTCSLSRSSLGYR